MGQLISDIKEKYELQAVDIADSEVMLLRNGLRLRVYDKGSLLGFTLENDGDGRSVYIVHDTDNYPRDNKRFNDMYEDAHLDALHVADMLMSDKIAVKSLVKKGLFRNKTHYSVMIPDKLGLNNWYDGVVVNAVSFRRP